MLLDVARELSYVPFQVRLLVDERRRYHLDLDPRFPLAIQPFAFSALTDILRFNWHERLEIFVPVAGRGRFRMGEDVLEFSRGDVIVVENLKLHGLVECSGPERRGLVITFLPELICSPGSYACDSVYLMPFFSAGGHRILRSSDRHAPAVDQALGKLVSCYFEKPRETSREAGCKAYLLEALYHIARHFQVTGESLSDFASQRRRSAQFGRLYEYLRENYFEPVTVAEAAGISGMSEFRFMKFFKKTTGVTFVKYLTQLRLNHAYRLLVESDRSIAEIASSAGFSDQSYFDRRFRALYGRTPREVRAAAGISR